MQRTITEYHSPSIDFLLDNGPHIPVIIASHPTVALLDSGARFSYIDIELAANLSAPQAGQHTAHGATSTDRHPSFDVSFYIPLLSLSLRSPIRGLPLREQEHFWQVIVGRDVLRNYELTIDWRTGLIRFVGF
jgi:hypothetical protein